ncbi:hypothetical protein C1645_857201 [Glomus cerebriforme]|uniref:Uncharacterized protein n=1 Tax=Glomus cerebriforme TaxID=658196 RepID=A0A397TEL1_9GLOM|nr:hypothetical protein C1645_857201 [Glomus cerebriforme]
MESLYDELRIEIFKFVNAPISLALTNRKWYSISQDPHVRAEWLIYKYGRAHALFHAVRLGNSFITNDAVQALLARNATMSRYFIQRLLMHFDTYDEKLIELTPWASNLPSPIFTKLITEGYNILNDKELTTKGNDMELFHFLSAGPLVINDAPQKFLQNLHNIEDLILNKKFIPFPPRPKSVYEDSIEYIQLMQARTHEDYPPKDGFENSRQLNVIARAILIHPDLVNLWKKIGYHEICSDVNELVMQEIRKESTSVIACTCLTQTIRPERNHRKTNLLEFLIKRIDNPEEALDNTLKSYDVGFKFDVNSLKTLKIRSLSVHSNIYYWILKSYGPNSKITQTCFEDIIESRIWIDIKLQENRELEIPEHLTSLAFNSICSIYLEFCNERIPFKTNFLPYLKLTNNEEIIKPLFGISLPIIFGLKLKCKPFKINYECDRPEVKLNKKRKFSEFMDNQLNEKNEMEKWSIKLKEMHDNRILDNFDVTDVFKKNFEKFWERIIYKFNIAQ